MTSVEAPSGPTVVAPRAGGGMAPGPAAVALLRQFPPRPDVADWAVTCQRRERVLARLRAAPLLTGGERTQRAPPRRAGPGAGLARAVPR